MYKHLLIAFDGSELAEKALLQGLELAKSIGARTSALYVTMPWSSIAIGEVAVMFPPEEYETNAAKAAEEQLGRAAEAARNAGVPCETLHTVDAQPYKSIVETAASKSCDLIVLASHGRRGIAGLLLGSVAAKTLVHAHVPVLVYRE